MDDLRLDLRYAARSLARRPGFACVAILTLALGIGATTAMFSVVRGILLRPLPYPESDRLVTIWEATAGDAASLDGGLLSHANFRDVRDQVEGVESIALVNGANLTVATDDGAELVRGAVVTPGLFTVLRAPLLRGRDFTREENLHRGPAVAIVGAGYWRDRLGGREDILGSTIQIGGTSHQIVGVAPEGFDYPGAAGIWIPAQNDEAGCGRGCVNRGSVARLTDDVSTDEARAALETLATRLASEYPDTNGSTAFAIATLRDVTVGDVRPALWILLGAVGMVLLIACANVANLLLVRGRGRMTEIAIRTTLGARGGRVLRQLMTESALIAFIGGVVGIGLASFGVDRVLALAPGNIPRLDEVALDPLSLAFAAALVAVTTVVFGLAPGLALARGDLANALRGAGRGDVSRGRSNRSRSLILTSEVALSVLLLVGAGLMVRSLVRLGAVEPGFDTEEVALFRLSLPRARYEPEARVAFMDRLQQQLAATPGIESAAVMVAPPLSNVSVFGGFSRTDLPAPETAADQPSANYRALGVGAPELLGVPVLAGRSFRASDRRDSEPVVILNQRAADLYFAGEDPVGKQIHVQVSTGFDELGPRTIVGVIGDTRSSRLTQPAGAEMYVPYAQAGSGFPHVLMRGPDRGRMLEAARQELARLDPGLPMMQPGTLEGLADAQLAQTRFYVLLLGLFAGLAVVLAAVGMYGVVAYAVSQRTREIGVRMALGARVPQVVRLILWQGLKPAAWGIGLGVIAALWGGSLMRRLLYDVVPQDPVTLVAVPVLLLATVTLACAIPARRATRIPPASALRSE